MTVDIERHDRVLLIRMNRPHKRNAVGAEMTAALDAAFNEFDDDPELWVAVLTGTDDMFSAGTDLSEGLSKSTVRGGEYGLIRRPREKPLIAAVEGRALGGGMELVLACDLVIAARGASFALSEVKRGVIATCGGLFRAHRALPVNVARQLLLTGEALPAERAYQLGFVNELTEDGGAVAAALAMARQIVANAPLSVRESLRAVERVLCADDEGATADALAALQDSKDLAEGITAFFERRPPRWQAR
ncbi:enoyl-CoA hydratase-related protein [Nocardia crassostreae]|uniref:enoyl-CoA hydratase-related protein n=1 Tax=Nocardia crassostreae TaxID=53428 RepID=UPI00082A2117|nr:enoyl-CoA hydratase-related protein [Nocardia crassostreae]